MTPFVGFGPASFAVSGLEDADRGSSPVENVAVAKEYMSEKTRGIKGSFPKIPHLWLVSASGVVGLLIPPPPRDVSLRWPESDSDRGGFDGCGISKIWRVDLSDVTARSWPEGAMETEKILA